MKRPCSHHGSVTSTPLAAEMIELLGGEITEGVALTSDQFRAARRLYGHVEEKPGTRPEKPVEPNTTGMTYPAREVALRKYEIEKSRYEKWEDPRGFMQAGSDRNLFREMSVDGMRMIAWLSQHINPGEDPVKVLISLAMDAGWDVSPEDCQFANEDEATGSSGRSDE